MNLDPRAIQLVTQRYEHVQGLRLVAIGAAVVSCFGAYAVAEAPGGDWGMIGTMAAAFCVTAAGMALAGRYYCARFGRAVQPPATTAGLWLPATIALTTTIGANVLDTGPLSIGLMMNAGLALWITIRDWPFRPHWLFGVVACGVLANRLFTLPWPHRNLDDAIALAVLGGVLVVMGALDHRLLTSVMRGEAGLKSCATREGE